MFMLLACFICDPVTAYAKGVYVVPIDDQSLKQQEGTELSPPLEKLPGDSGTQQKPSGTERPERQVAAALPAKVLRDKLGTEKFEKLQRILENLEAMPSGGSGRGAPNADQWFDLAAPRQGGDDVTTRTNETRFFSNYQDTTVVDAHSFVGTYGGIPGGGVVLEGVADGLDSIEEIGYHHKFNAFVLDGRAVYFLPIPPPAVAILCRAIARKDQVGVSLGKTQLVYGIPKSSRVASDLKLADHFLGDIVFATNDWSRGYHFADDFTPSTGKWSPIAVFFRFGDFKFGIQQQEVVLTRANLRVTLVPLSNETAADGNLLPDEDAIRRGDVSSQLKSNAQHIADNIAYYRREQIINRAFAYGEVAAFLRWLKSEGTDLQELAAQIDGQ